MLLANFFFGNRLFLHLNVRFCVVAVILYGIILYLCSRKEVVNLN